MNPKTALITLSIAIPLLMFLTIRPKKYEVEITFCDGRPKEIIIVKSIDAPTNYSIIINKHNLPYYKGHLNVCNVKTLKQINK